MSFLDARAIRVLIFKESRYLQMKTKMNVMVLVYLLWTLECTPRAGIVFSV